MLVAVCSSVKAMGALCCSGDKAAETETPVASRSEGFAHYDHQVLAAESSYLTYFSGLKATGPLPTGACGLANLGNTCFINSAIQSICAIPSVSDYFLSGSYKSELSRRRSGVMASLFAGLLLQRWKQGLRVSRPNELVNYVWRQSHFSPKSQNDSQEFLAYFLDQLHEDLNKAHGKFTPSKAREGTDEEGLADLAWQDHLQRNQSIVVDKFQGLLKSSLTCLRCKHTSVTFEPFMFLSVPIPSGRADTLKECLSEFTTAEKLGGSERWTCPKCKVPMEARKKLELWKVPPVLIIHLKRFYYQQDSMGKLAKAISYPITNLSLDKFLGKSNSRLPSYNLQAKINHMGSITSGHYTAHVHLNGVWVECDDERCSIADPASLQSCSTYVLIYTAAKEHDTRCTDASVSFSSITTLAE